MPGAGRGLPELRQFLLERATLAEWTLEAGQATDRGEEEQVRRGQRKACSAAAPGSGLAASLGHACHLLRASCACLFHGSIATAGGRLPPPICALQALEVVREKLFRRLYAELPYSVQLRVTSCLPADDGSGAPGCRGGIVVRRPAQMAAQAVGCAVERAVEGRARWQGLAGQVSLQPGLHRSTTAVSPLPALQCG